MRPVLLPSLLLAMAVLCAPAAARADDPFDVAKKLGTAVAKEAGNGLKGEVEKRVNDKLLSEARKNQCSFKSDTDVLQPGCDRKLRNLADALITAKRDLAQAGIGGYKFEVSGHTDSTGTAEHNKELSLKRATVIARQLTTRGIPESEIISVGLGADRPLVTPDNTPAKKARNRRYELRVRL